LALVSAIQMSLQPRFGPRLQRFRQVVEHVRGPPIRKSRYWRICTVRSNRFALLALRPELGPVMQTAPDFGCVEHRATLATV
jgi:hypothetical protein